MTPTAASAALPASPETSGARQEPADGSARLGLWLGLAFVVALAPYLLWPNVTGGDVASHLYSGSIYRQVERGDLVGVSIRHRFSNSLTDRILLALSDLGAPAEVASVALHALMAWTFIAGCLLAGRSLAGRWPTRQLPIIVCLTFGWTFSIGFSNYVLGVSLAFIALFLLGHERLRLLSLPILVLGAMANPLPVLWAVEIAVYMALRRRWPNRSGALSVLLLVATFLVGAASHVFLHGEWSRSQAAYVTGFDQFYVFDGKYKVPALALLCLTLACWITEMRASAARTLTKLSILGAASIVVLMIPSGLWLPGERVPIWYVAERSSIIVCAMALVLVPFPRQWALPAGIALSLLFLVLRVNDFRQLSRVTSEIDHVVQEAPRGSSIVGQFSLPASCRSRIELFQHLIDSACIGRCYSYGFYEPATHAFLVQSDAPNRYFEHNPGELDTTLFPRFEVPPKGDFYAVEEGAGGQLQLRPLPNGTGASLATVIRTPLWRPRCAR